MSRMERSSPAASAETGAPGLHHAAARELVARPRLARLLAVLDRDGEEARVVGGAVRNALLGRPVADVDVATTALPEITSRRAAEAGFKAVPTGLRHGTITVVVEGQPIEVTTLREDVETDGRHAVVRFGRDFAADAARRDFTLNALSVDRAGTLHDPVGGLADLAAGRVRFIGEPRQRIREDFLRTLRFFRFHADYAAGPIDADGLDAAIREREGLARLSRERVGGEIRKLLVARRAVETIAVAETSGLLGRLSGSIADLGRLGRAAQADPERRDPALRLAALWVRSTADALRLQEGLRLANAEAVRLAAYAGCLAGLLTAEGALDPPALRRLLAMHGLVALSDAAAILRGEPRPVWTPDGEAALARYQTGETALPHFPLTGAELVRRGIPPGPEVGRRLAAARARWLAAGCPPDWREEG